MMEYKYKIKDKVRFKNCETVYKIAWIHKSEKDQEPYFLVVCLDDTAFAWSSEDRLEPVQPAKPRTSRKELKARIAELEKVVKGLNETRAKESKEALDYYNMAAERYEQITELETSSAAWQSQAITNGQAIEKLQNELFIESGKAKLFKADCERLKDQLLESDANAKMWKNGTKNLEEQLASDSYVPMSDYRDKLEKLEAVEKQLEAARESVRIVEALESMRPCHSLHRGKGGGWWITYSKDLDWCGCATPLKGALCINGLLDAKGGTGDGT